MTISIYKSDGTEIVLADGVISNVYSASLLGRSVAAYTGPEASNVIHMLENFSNPIPPRGAIKGQLWFDSIKNALKVWIGPDPTATDDDSSQNPSNPFWISVAGNFSDDVIPAPNVTLGSPSNRFKNIYSEAADLLSLKVTGPSELLGNITVGGNIIPTLDRTFVIGTQDKRFEEVRAFAFIGSEFSFRHSSGTTPGFVLDGANTISPKTNLTALGSTSNRYASINSSLVDTTVLRVSTSSNGTSGVGSSLIPMTNLSYDLGDATRYYNRSFVSSYVVGNNIYPANNNAGTVGTSSLYFANGFINTVTADTILPKTSISNIGSTGSRFSEIFASALRGNADTATRWSSARTITFNGDLNGSLTIDGSSNVTGTIEVVDNSHNHVISNITGLQSALDAKASLVDLSQYVRQNDLNMALNTTTAAAHGYRLNTGGVQRWTIGKDASENLTVLSYNNDGSFRSTALSITRDGTGIFSQNVGALSDARLKTDVRKLTNSLDSLQKINGYRYVKDGKNDIGVIAQEIETVYPELVFERFDGYKAVNYQQLTAVLLESIKELNKKIELLERKIK